LFGLESPDDVDRLLPEWNQPQIVTGTEGGQSVSQDGLEKGHERCVIRFPKFFTMPLLFEPGTGWNYGPGHDVAGLLVARANDCTLEGYMRKNIFDVLGMTQPLRPALIMMLLRVWHPWLADLRPTSRSVTRTHLSCSIIKISIAAAACSAQQKTTSICSKPFCATMVRVLKPETVDTLFESIMSPSSDAALNRTLVNPAMAAAMTPGEPIV
jgi:hypothetical protein